MLLPVDLLFILSTSAYSHCFILYFCWYCYVGFPGCVEASQGFRTRKEMPKPFAACLIMSHHDCTIVCNENIYFFIIETINIIAVDTHLTNVSSIIQWLHISRVFVSVSNSLMILHTMELFLMAFLLLVFIATLT